MVSALVNNVGMTPPESFLDLSTAYSSFGWLSPRISFSRDFPDEEKPHIIASTAAADAEKKPKNLHSSPMRLVNPPENADLDATGKDLAADFEFGRINDAVTMLPADELFSDGKLVPLQMASVRPQPELSSPRAEIRSPEPQKPRQRTDISGSNPYVFSPKAPRCSNRWRELLGLKKAPSNIAKAPEIQKVAPAKNTNPRTLKHYLRRNPKSSSSIDSSLNLPLLRDSDSEPVSISSRLSLSSTSSSSSGPDHEDLPLLSLDSDKPSQIPVSLSRNPPRVRVFSKPRTSTDPSRHYHLDHHHPVGTGTARIGRSPMRRVPDATIPPPVASVDSPRMNSSGKIVFQSLERSSSSPSSFNGVPRMKHRGMERSYSANVRVTPVLNVPVCSLRGSSKSVSVFGFGQLFSPQKKETTAAAVAGRSIGGGKNSKGERA